MDELQKALLQLETHYQVTQQIHRDLLRDYDEEDRRYGQYGGGVQVLIPGNVSMTVTIGNRHFPHARYEVEVANSDLTLTADEWVERLDFCRLAK